MCSDVWTYLERKIVFLYVVTGLKLFANQLKKLGELNEAPWHIYTTIIVVFIVINTIPLKNHHTIK